MLSDLPKVPTKSFETYIGSIKDEYTTWSKVQSALADAPLLDELEGDDAGLDEESSKRRKAIKRALETSNMSSKSSRKIELPPLDSIPPIFFEENFNLANPRTFDIVTAGHGTGSGTEEDRPEQGSSSTGFSTDQILQEKLAHWLEVVELHLNVEISLRSASFFSALSNLKELDSQSAEAVKQIGDIKCILNEVDAKIAKQGLEAVRQGIRRRRLNDLDVALERIKEILRALDQAEELGEAGETEGALDLADEIEREWELEISSPSEPGPQNPAVESSKNKAMMAISEEQEEADAAQVNEMTVIQTPLTAFRAQSHQSRPVRIAHIKSLASLPTRLYTLRSLVAQSLQQELLAVLVHAAREDRQDLIALAPDWRSTPGVQVPAFGTMQESTSNRVNGTIRGLVRCGKPALDEAIVAWKAAILQEVRRTLRDMLPPSTLYDDDETAGNSPSSRSSLDGVRTPPELA